MGRKKTAVLRFRTTARREKERVRVGVEEPEAGPRSPGVTGQVERTALAFLTSSGRILRIASIRA